MRDDAPAADKPGLLWPPGVPVWVRLAPAVLVPAVLVPAVLVPAESGAAR